MIRQIKQRRFQFFILLLLTVLTNSGSVIQNHAQSKFRASEEISAPVAIFTVTTTVDGGAGSLRQAITDANNSPGADEIRFNIAPNDGTVKTISPAFALPTITGAVTIDGYTQPQASANTLANGSNAVLLIEIVGKGTSTNNSFNGLEITAGNSTVRGLVLRNLVAGISILNNGGNQIEGNRIGTNAAGTNGSGNSRGVDISGSIGNQIGGVALAQRNLISSNSEAGIRTVSNADSNIIENNYVGTNAAGNAALGNGAGFFFNPGIEINTSSNRIGGTAAGAGNLLSGNVNFGIFIRGGTNNLVQGNRIGTNAAGTAAVPNIDGVQIQYTTTDNTIGGTALGAGNLISGNTRDGISVSANVNGARRTTIQGNLIGVAADGTSPLPNNGNGIFGKFIDSIIGANVSGGAGANTIAYNSRVGVALVTDPFNPSVYFGCRVLSNKIYNNNGIGIDLSQRDTPDGISQNDAGDPDPYANNLQNFPLISAVSTGSGTRIQGSLNSLANTQFVIEFFSSQVATLAAAEGQTLLGSRTVTTNGSGNIIFDETFPVNTAGQTITATATNLTTFDTSEFTSMPLMPTASTSTIAGKVLSNGRGMARAKVTLTGADGAEQTVLTNTFGNFTFFEVESGATYILEISAKRKMFAPQVISVIDNVTGLTFNSL